MTKWLIFSNKKSSCIEELLKEEREKANLTQAEMAEKTGTKKVTFRELKMAEPTFSYQPYIS